MGSILYILVADWLQADGKPNGLPGRSVDTLCCSSIKLFVKNFFHFIKLTVLFTSIVISFQYNYRMKSIYFVESLTGRFCVGKFIKVSIIIKIGILV